MQVNYHLQDCTFADNRQPWIDCSVVASFYSFLSYLTSSFPLSLNTLSSTFSTSITSANAIYLQPANLNLPRGLPLLSARYPRRNNFSIEEIQAILTELPRF
jgi:hypothetical protein